MSKVKKKYNKESTDNIDAFACMPNLTPDERDYFENLDRQSNKCGYEAFVKKERKKKLVCKDN